MGILSKTLEMRRRYVEVAAALNFDAAGPSQKSSHSNPDRALVAGHSNSHRTGGREIIDVAVRALEPSCRRYT